MKNNKIKVLCIVLLMAMLVMCLTSCTLIDKIEVLIYGVEADQSGSGNTPGDDITDGDDDNTPSSILDQASGLKYALKDQAYYVVGFNSTTKKNFVIPDTFSNLPVTAISGNAFENCTNIVSIEMGDNLTTIGDFAFKNCTNLTKVNISKSVTSIGNCAFKNCPLIDTINVDEENENFVAIDDVLYSSDMKKLILFAADNDIRFYSVPKTVTSIGTAAFENCNRLEGVVIRLSVTSVASEAFINCKYTTVNVLYAENKDNASDNHPALPSSWMSEWTTTSNVYRIAYAFDATEYTIAFDSQGGTSVASQLQYSEYFISKPDAPTRTGYRFDGWYDSTECTGTEISFPLKVLTDRTIYAKWIKQCTVTYITADGTAIKPVTVDEGTKVPAPTTDPTRNNYRFNGWYNDEEATISHDFSIALTDNINVYAGWIQLCSIVFDTQGGTSIDATDYTNRDKGTVVQAPANPQRTDYVFKGWYLDAECSADKEFSFGDGYTLTDIQVILYAKWNPAGNIYFINTAANIAGTDSQYAFDTNEFGYTVDAPLTNPAAPVGKDDATGYRFDGWWSQNGNKNSGDWGTQVAFPYTIETQNIYIYGRWVKQYTVNFDMNGDDNTSTELPITQDKGTSVVAPADPTRKGYTFAGWTAKDASGTLISGFEFPYTLNDTDADITVIANWTINQYTATFVGGDGATYTGNSITKNYLQSITLSDVAALGFAKEGNYRIEGWYSDADCTDGNEVIFDDEGDTFTFSDEDDIFYAKWIKLYDITYNLNGADSGTTVVKTYDEGFVIPASALMTPKKIGYKVSGWGSNADGTGTMYFELDEASGEMTVSQTYTVSADDTIYAIWVKDTFYITYIDNDGTELDTIGYEYQSQVTRPEDPIKDGYIFDLWFDQNDNEVEFGFNMGAEPLIYKAQWIIINQNPDYLKIAEDGITVIGLDIDMPGTKIAFKIPETYTKIGDEAFMGLGGIKGIVMNDNITDIGEKAFMNCTGIGTMYIPDSLETLGNLAFAGCTKLARFTSGNENYGNYWADDESGVLLCEEVNNYKIIWKLAVYPAGKLDSSFTTPSNVKGFSDYAFYGITALESLTISNESFDTIGEGTFIGCTNLTNITFNSNSFTFSNGVLYRNLEEYTDNIADLQSGRELVFYAYTNTATEYTVEADVKMISTYAFYNHQNLVTLTIPSTVLVIGHVPDVATKDVGDIGSVRSNCGGELPNVTGTDTSITTIDLSANEYYTIKDSKISLIE